MTSYRCEDWSDLAGINVEIRRHRRRIRYGIVDAVMPDSSMLWLAAGLDGGRCLFDSAEGYEVWADPVDLPDALCSRMICDRPDRARVPDDRLGHHEADHTAEEDE